MDRHGACLLKTSKATLFSAIVTAFTIESSKLLQVDHQESAAKILFVIHQQLNSIARQNVTILPPLVQDPVSTFEAPVPAVIVNTSWLLSLIVSLTTASLGIFCLQWLREHQEQPSGNASQVFPLLILRIHRIDQWRVASIISLLPILLQTSFFLFLAGFALLLVSSGLPSHHFLACVVLVIYCLFFALFILPVAHPNCALRTPQASFVRSSLLDSLRRAWYRLRQPRPEPIVYATRQFVNLEVWSRIDVHIVRKSRDFGYQWFAKAFAYDMQAIQALVACVDMQVRHSRANDTVEELELDKKVRLHEMLSLRRLLPQEPLQHYAFVDQWPSGLAYDVAMAHCIDYATDIHPSLAPDLVVRRSELQLKILSRASSEGLESAAAEDIVQRLLEDFTTVYREHLAQTKTLSKGEYLS